MAVTLTTKKLKAKKLFVVGKEGGGELGEKIEVYKDKDAKTMPICTIRAKNVTEAAVKPKVKPKDKKPGPIILIDSTLDAPYTFHASNDAECAALASFIELYCVHCVMTRD